MGLLKQNNENEYKESVFSGWAMYICTSNIYFWLTIWSVKLCCELCLKNQVLDLQSLFRDSKLIGTTFPGLPLFLPSNYISLCCPNLHLYQNKH